MRRSLCDCASFSIWWRRAVLRSILACVHARLHSLMWWTHQSRERARAVPPVVATQPGLIGDHLYVGNKYHAADVDLLGRLGVSGVLNCASSGIRDLPIDAYRAENIEYRFTVCAELPMSHADGLHVPHFLPPVPAARRTPG